jgi:hypothetical protein
MKRSLVVVFATLALVLGLSGQASAAAPQASCAAKISSSLAGQPGERAEIAHTVKVDSASEGVPPGAFQSEVAHSHQPLEEC